MPVPEDHPYARARILLLAAAETFGSVMSKLGCDARFILRWRGRFLEQRLSGLHSRHVGRQVYKVDPSVEARSTGDVAGMPRWSMLTGPGLSVVSVHRWASAWRGSPTSSPSPGRSAPRC